MSREILDLNWAEKDAICKTRGLHIKYTQQIRDYPDFYETKINKLQGVLFEERGKYDELLQKCKDKLTAKDIDELSDILQISQKIDRLKAKQKAVQYELEGRKLGHFKREPHGTVYYIDLNAGNDGNTGLHWTTPWLTIQQYASVTVRTPGDKAYIRANTQQIIVAVVDFDEDGDQDNYIYIIGCDATTDPWGDGSNVKPVINANGGAFYLYLNTDDYWNFDNLDLTGNNGGANCILYIRWTHNCKFFNIDFHDNISGISNWYGSNPCFYGCEFWNNSSRSFYSAYTGNKIIFDNCVFNGGAGGSGYGIQSVYGGGNYEIIDSSFGQTTTHGVHDILTSNATSIFKLRNTLYNSIAVGKLSFGGFQFSEDDNQNYGNYIIISHPGAITKNTGVKTGGADFSLEFEPNTYCGLNNPLKAEAFDLTSSNYTIDGTAGVEITATIKIRSLGAWAVYPTADELYIEAFYYSNAGTCERSAVRSTMVLDDETTWREFSITMTPARSGAIYINVYLKKYEANKGCYVNGEVVTS